MQLRPCESVRWLISDLQHLPEGGAGGGDGGVTGQRASQSDDTEGSVVRSCCPAVLPQKI